MLNLKRIASSFGLVAVFMLSLAGPAFADDVTGQGTVTGGSLAMTATDAPTVAVTLNGTDQTATDTFAISVNDPRGTGVGWHLSISATQFTANDASGKTLSASAASITAASAVCDQGTCTNPTNSVGYPLTLATTAAPLFNAAADTGMGDFTVTPTFQVSVPANTYAKTYESTITITIDTGP